MDADSEIKGVKGVSLNVSLLPCPASKLLSHKSINSSLRFIDEIGTSE